MMNKFFLTLLIFTFSLTSCTKKNLLQKEQQVFYSLLPTLLDSMYANKGGVIPPPVIKTITAEGKITYHNPQDTIMPNFYLYNKLVIPSFGLRDQLLKHFMITNDAGIRCSNSEYEISQQEVNPEATSFKLVYKIEPKERETAVITFSTICLDSSLRFGALEGNLYCGSKCGRSFIIFIKDVSGQWQIDAIENTGVY